MGAKSKYDELCNCSECGGELAIGEPKGDSYVYCVNCGHICVD